MGRAPSSGSGTSRRISFPVAGSRKARRIGSMTSGPARAPPRLKLTYQREKAKARVRELEARWMAVCTTGEMLA